MTAVNKSKKTEEAAFGAGCFWGVEETFRKVPGVIDTKVGFMGGSVANPTYEQVCTGKTGHAETVYVEFDPSKVSYAQLLKTFWQSHDPTTLNQQGPDIGSQYRSVIFTYNQEQKKEAQRSLAEAQKNFQQPIVTEIISAGDFYPAEEYHQRYLEKQGGGNVCH